MKKIKLELLFKNHFKKLKINQKFEDCNMENTKGWDSVEHINFLLKIEKEYSMKFNTKDFFELNSIKSIKKRLNK